MSRNWQDLIYGNFPHFMGHGLCSADGGVGDGAGDGGGGAGGAGGGGASGTGGPKPGTEGVGDPKPLTFTLDAETAQLLPDKYRDPATKEFRFGEFVKGHVELEGAFGKKADDLKASLRPELENEIKSGLFKDRPGTIDDYKMPEAKDLGIPDYLSFTPDPNDALGKWWRQTAYDAGLSQAQYAAGVKAFAEYEVGRHPNFPQEMKALGENGPARIEMVKGWAERVFGEDKDGFALFDESLFTTAKGIQLVEGLMKKFGEPSVGGTGGGGAGGPTDTAETIAALQGSPAYLDSSHPEFHQTQARVAAFYRQQAAQKRV